MTNNRETIILMSRGRRLAHFFKEAAQALKKDYDVIVFIDKEEENIWKDIEGVQNILSYETFLQEAEKEGINLETAVREIEKEIGLTLFESASNYILYRKFTKRNLSRWKKWIIDDRKLLMQCFVGAYKILSKLIKEKKVALIFYETPDLIQCRIALKIAAQYKIFALGFQSGYYKGKMLLTYNLTARIPLLEYYYKNRNLINHESYQEARFLLESIKKENWIPNEVGRKRREVIMFSSWRTLPFIAIKKIFYGFLTLQPRKYITMIFNVLWLNRYSHKNLPQQPYLVFLLHSQPEAQTCCRVPRWVNQENVIEQVAINAPSNILILIKEHFANYGLRNRSYLKELCDLPNVYLCSCDMETREIVAGAEAVLTLTGRVGFQAILLGKRVGVLGRPFYSVYKGVKLLNYPEEIFSAMNDVSWRPEEMAQERLVFAAAYIQSLYDFGYGECGRFWPKRGGDKWADAIRDFLKKKIDYNLTPDMFNKNYHS